MKFLITAIYLLLTSSGLVLFKLGANDCTTFSLAKGIVNFKISLLSIAGIICYGISFILYLGLVSKLNLSYIVPVTTGIMQILILLASIYIFKETVTLTNIIGVIVVLVGIALINL